MKTSVLIATINDPQLKRTIQYLRNNAKEEVEFIVINDGGNALVEYIDITHQDINVLHHSETQGRRVSFNQAANLATGDYLLIIDPHCSMTKDWDVKMRKSCGDKNLAYPVIRDMDKSTWNYRPGDYTHVSMNTEWTEKWWCLKPLRACEVEEESMCFTGCGWMIKRERYWELGGYDESLGKYGWDGPEWSCKMWFNGGKVILRTDVICGHVFGTNDDNKLYTTNMMPKHKYIEYMQNKWGDRLPELLERFAPVPDWHEKGKTMKTQNKRRQIKLRWTDETVERDDNDEIVGKVITHYEYVYIDNGQGEPDRKKLLEAYYDKRKKVSEEVWTLKDGKLQKSA
jgi:glycosyltransferase involved in cell wall biosynthesis